MCLEGIFNFFCLLAEYITDDLLFLQHTGCPWMDGMDGQTEGLPHIGLISSHGPGLVFSCLSPT